MPPQSAKELAIFIGGEPLCRRRETAKVRPDRARPPIGRRGVEQHRCHVAQRRAGAARVEQVEHDRVPPRVGEERQAKRWPESDRAAEALRRLCALGKIMLRMKIEAEGAAARRREAVGHPERQLGCVRAAN